MVKVQSGPLSNLEVYENKPTRCVMLELTHSLNLKRHDLQTPNRGPHMVQKHNCCTEVTSATEELQNIQGSGKLAVWVITAIAIKFILFS